MVEKFWRLFVYLGIGLISVSALSSAAWAYRIGDVDINFSGGLSTIYDDNITYADDNAITDVHNDINAGISAAYEGKLRKITILGSLTRQIFVENDDFDNTSGRVDVNYTEEFSKYDRLEVTDRYVRGYEPQSFFDEFGNINGRYSYFRNKLILEYERNLSEKWQTGSSFMNEVFEHSGDRVRDSFLNKIGGKIAYTYSPRTYISVGYSFAYRNYHDGDAIYTSRPYGGIKYFITDQMSVYFRNGLDITTSGSGTNVGDFLETTLRNDIDENSSLTFSFTRETSSSSYRDEIFENQRLSLIYDRQLFRRLYGSFEVFYGDGNYEDSDSNERLNGISAGLGYDIRDNARLSLTYSYSSKDSDIDSGYVKNFVSADLRIYF
jgi:hypothetical protein